MLKRRFEPLGRDLSCLVLGTMALAPDDLDRSFALLDAWREAGGNVVDTAHIYGGGHCERVLGRWMKERGTRERLSIIGKGAHHNVDRKRVTPEDIASDLRDSLVRMQTDFVDLYLLHRDDPDVPVGEIVDALNAQMKTGRVRAFGGSNWTPARLAAANAYAAGKGLAGFTASSPHLSLALPNGEIWAGCVAAIDTESRDWYAKTQMPLFAWSSQARGFFSGRFHPGKDTDATVTRVYYSDTNWGRFRRAEEFGKRRGRFTANQVALAWVLRQPFPVFALIGPHNVDELRSSLAALELSLTPDECRWLETGE